MSLKLFLYFILLNNVKGDRFHLGDRLYVNRRFEDIYTNHRNPEEVLHSYRDVYEVPYRTPKRIYPEKISLGSFETNADLDRMDFHYPQVEFMTKNDNLVSEYGDFDNGYSFTQSQTVPNRIESTEKPFPRNPRLKQSKQNYTVRTYKPVRLSYVQKITKPQSNKVITSNKISKYAELLTDATETTTKAIKTQDKITGLLKKYLANLYTKKYNSTNLDSAETATGFPNDFESSEGSPETKLFLNNQLVTKKKNKINKIKKLFSLFTIVQFNNTQCNATNEVGSYLGLCYTAAECSNLGGTAVGNCASGYGVCCIFKGTCGGSASQNCSYFESPNYPDYYPAGGMVIVPTTMAPPATTINPSPTPDPRIYWNFFNNELARQSTDNTLSCIFSVYKVSDSVTKMKIDFLDLELAGATNGTCTVESLVITGQSSNFVVPPICGYNTGNQNNLNYAICIKKQPGYCSITYTNVMNGVEFPFNLVNFANGVTTVPVGTAGVGILDCPNDYIVIDGTSLCGYKFNDGSVNSNLSVNAPVTGKLNLRIWNINNY
ncbi:unnamed protein product [Diabrotica balteata]|uniref:CUB domain-containing protein n=1 Tax=Diabrotica balteata TaxID=107213 RepID=A0A9N9XCT8_DIABA|nr:unnamed protein product [Diabrotica balteata]